MIEPDDYELLGAVFVPKPRERVEVRPIQAQLWDIPRVYPIAWTVVWRFPVDVMGDGPDNPWRPVNQFLHCTPEETARVAAARLREADPGKEWAYEDSRWLELPDSAN